LSSAIIVSAQRNIERNQSAVSTSLSSKDIEQLPFRKNFNNFTIQQNFQYSRLKPDNSSDHTSDVNIKIDYNRFVVDHFAVGGEVDILTSKDVSGSYTFKNSEWMLYGNLIYGSSAGNFNWYGKAAVGFGQSKATSGSSTDKNNLFGYIFELGSPIHLYNDGGNYITPYISYNSLQQKDNGVKYTDNQFQFGFRFQNYSPCSGYQCDCHHGRSFSKGIYDQGRSFIGYSSMGDFGFGNSKTTFNNATDKSTFSGGSLNFEYGYYFTKDIAIGAGLDWFSSTDKSGGTKYTNSGITFMPTITLNAPSDNCWENLFLKGGYGFGMEKSKSGSSEDKYNTTALRINLGYNDMFGKHIAFTPTIGYEFQTFKDTSTDIKDKQSGLAIGMGCSLHW
jgi:hypothetical protein